MQISLTNPTETTAKITIVASEAELTAIKQQVLSSFQQRVRIQGFREGKAPLALVEKNVDPSSLQSNFLDEAINQMYSKAISEKKLRVVANPSVSVTKFVPFTALEFVAEVEALGEVKLPDYKKIKITKEVAKVTADDVNKVIDSLKKRVAEKKDVDRAVKAGDEAWIDFSGVDAKGAPINGAEAKDYPLAVGSNSFIPGFEDNVVGMSAGEDKTFTLTFPKDYGVKALAGKKVTFTVSVTKVQEVIEPKLDDAFAAQAGPFQTLAELKADIKKQLTIEKEREVETKYQNDIVEAIAAKTKVAIPKSMVDSQLDRIEQDERQNLTYRGQTWDEHLAEEGITAEQHREQKRTQAESQIRAGLALAEIADQEKIDVTTEELDARMAELRARYTDKQMQAELSKPDAAREIASRLMTEKTLALLTSQA